MAKAITTNPKKQPHSSIFLGLILRFVVTTLVVKITGNRTFKTSSKNLSQIQIGIGFWLPLSLLKIKTQL